MLITIKTTGGTIAINPEEVAELVPCNQLNVLDMTMKNRIKHYVVGDLGEVMGAINVACIRGQATRS